MAEQRISQLVWGLHCVYANGVRCGSLWIKLTTRKLGTALLPRQRSTKSDRRVAAENAIHPARTNTEQSVAVLKHIYIELVTFVHLFVNCVERQCDCV